MIRTIFASLIFVISVIVADLIFGFLITPPKSGNCYKHDPILYHAFIPNSQCEQKSADWHTKYFINSLGLRNPELQIPKPEGITRILLLGNSFTEGKGVTIEESMSKQLENLLLTEPSASHTYEVINAGIQGSSPLLEYLLLKEKGPVIQPDLVIVSMSLIDFYDENRYVSMSIKDSNSNIVAVPYQEKTGVTDKIVSLPERLLSYRLLKQKYLTYSRLYQWPGNDVGNKDLDIFYILRDIPTQEKDFLITQLSESLLRIKQETEKQNAKLLVVLYPFGVLVNGDEWPGRTYWGFLPGKTYSSDVFSRLETFANQNMFSLHNALPDFQSTNEKPLFFSFDGHFTPIGHQIIAKSIYYYLLKNPTLLKQS